MWFWIRNLTLGTILIIAAYVMLNFEDFTFPTLKLGGDNQSQSSNDDDVNPAAKGFSDFYSNFRGTLSSGKQGDFVLDSTPPAGTVSEELTARRSVVKPGSKSWTGAVKSRPFAKGETLKTRLSSYAKQEGLELFWYLDKDYVVKYQINEEANFIDTLYKVAEALDSDFSQSVSAWYCPNERAAIITDKQEPYLTANCINTLEDAMDKLEEQAN